MILLLGCGSKTASSTASKKDAGDGHGYARGTICDGDQDCASGLCVQAKKASDDTPPEGFCSVRCKVDADCKESMQASAQVPELFTPACGTGPDGKRACMPPCDYKLAPVPLAYICQDGAPLACDVAPDSACDRCGCPKNERCDSGVGCADLSDLGGPCRMNADCRSNNCSGYAGVCRVPLGQPCSSDNCDRCILHDTWSYCSSGCSSNASCGGGACVPDSRYSSDYILACVPACGPECPGSCVTDPVNPGRGAFCDCSGCSVISAPHALGQICFAAHDCDSGVCYAPSVCDSRTCGGLCSQTCTSSADCGDGVCADVPCMGAMLTAKRCGKMCLPKCGANGACGPGKCRALPSVEGDTAMVCDTHLAGGVGCFVDSDCLSWRCIDKKCAPEGGADNGQTCAAASDCKSGNCSNSTCRGTSLLGDACGNDLDCEVGHCCSGKCC